MTKGFTSAFASSYGRHVKGFDKLIELAGELYYSSEVQGLSVFEQHLEINRLQHITAVACMSVRVCERLGLDIKSAARAAVMHDLFFYDWRDGETGRWHKLHGYKHPRYAVMNARELCADLSKAEESIILRHMWPLTLLPPTSPEGFVVSLADKYCATLEVIFSLQKSHVAYSREETL